MTDVGVVVSPNVAAVVEAVTDVKPEVVSASVDLLENLARRGKVVVV